MSPEEKRAYCRGYGAGRRGCWPEHRPPSPPNELVADLLAALRGLRDGYDTMCATFSPDDEIVTQLDPLIERADNVMQRVTEWVSGHDEQVRRSP